MRLPWLARWAGGVVLGLLSVSACAGSTAGDAAHQAEVDASNKPLANDANDARANETGTAALPDVATDSSSKTHLVHPGGVLTERELERIRAQVAAGNEPWSSAWRALDAVSPKANYQPNVSTTVTDAYALQDQGHAAYVLAMKWVASGDRTYADAAVRVIDAWANTVAALEATTLRTGIGAMQMANAAEIVAFGFYGEAQWSPAKVDNARRWFARVVWPLIGQANAQRSSNWGTSAMAGCMATAIFADDVDKFAYTVNAYRDGFSDAPDGCSGVTQYICNANGQATEAGRDQAHAQGGVAHLVEVALMAWNQGTDLVGYADARLVAGMEYLAKYNTNQDVPYDANFPDPCNVHPSWSVISADQRGVFSPVYEMANKLFTDANIAHPFTRQLLDSPGYVPEKTNTDHVGLGTLAFR